MGFDFEIILRKLTSCLPIILLLPLVSLVVFALNAEALPFNKDMFKSQNVRTGDMVRPVPPESVPIGGLVDRLETEADAQALSNPVKADELSLAAGKRLFEVNCSTCHGYYNDGVHKASPIGELDPNTKLPKKLLLPPPDLSGKTPGSETYRTRSDGFFYGTIHFGGAAFMPRMGFKLSSQETWDIVNYIRSIQGVSSEH